MGRWQSREPSNPPAMPRSPLMRCCRCQRRLLCRDGAELDDNVGNIKSIAESTISSNLLSATLHSESKTLVPLCRDLVALLPVTPNTTKVRHEHARLARNVCADIKGVGCGEKRRV